MKRRLTTLGILTCSMLVAAAPAFAGTTYMG